MDEEHSDETSLDINVDDADGNRERENVSQLYVLGPFH